MSTRLSTLNGTPTCKIRSVPSKLNRKKRNGFYFYGQGDTPKQKLQPLTT